MEPAQRGRDNGPHVLMRIVQMTDQGGNDRWADRFQDQREAGLAAPWSARRQYSESAEVGVMATIPKTGSAFLARS